MLQEIKDMEERLKASMKENRKKELDEMEERMKNNLKEIVDNSISEAFKNISTTVTSLIAAHPTITSHTNNLHQLELENKKLNRTVQILAAEQSKLKEKLETMERKNLDNCMIIRGIQKQYKETDIMLRERIFAEISNTVVGSDYNEKVEMAKKMTIRSCKRLGRYNRSRARPVSCEFVHPEDVTYIIENKNYLNEGIFVDNEYPPEVERKRRLLLPILRAARKLPQYRKNCRLEMDELVVNGRHFKLNTLHQLPDDLDPFKITTEEDMDSLGFFGAINPLSNFYECTFNIKDENYISSEQFIQSEKALYFKDQQVYDRIMGCNNSLDCKIEASYVKNYNRAKWEEVAKEICRTGIRAKFEQNPDILQTLVTKTGNKTIVECARDRFWGIGVPLADPDCLNTTKWLSNQGILGELLEEIRGEYRASSRMVTSLGTHPMNLLCNKLPYPQPLIENVAPPTPNPIHANTANPIDDMEIDNIPFRNVEKRAAPEISEDSSPEVQPPSIVTSSGVCNQTTPQRLPPPPVVPPASTPNTVENSATVPAIVSEDSLVSKADPIIT